MLDLITIDYDENGVDPSTLTFCDVHARDMDPGTLCPECEAQAVEIVEERTQMSKTLRLPSGFHVKEVSREPLHWHDGEGWRDFAPAWVDDGTVFRLTGVPSDVTVPKVGPGYTIRSGDRTCTARMLGGMGGVSAVPVGHRVFWEPDDSLTVYLVPHSGGVSIHYILRDESAPTAFTWDFVGDEMPWSTGGRDNLEGRSGRSVVDTHRLVEIVTESTGNRRTIRWTGRVVALDEMHRRSYSEDAIFPLRMKH